MVTNPLSAAAPPAGLNSLRYCCSSGRTPQAEAVVNERIERAVNPLVRDAKHALRAEAGPMKSLMCLRLRIADSSSSSECAGGPETTIEGRFQVLSAWRLGGPPIMPPSRNFTGIGRMSGSNLNEKEEVRRR